MRHTAFLFSFVVGILLGVGTFSSLSAQESIAWEKDINSAFAKAKAENRLVFLHFYGANCPPCKAMDADVFPNKQVVADMNRYFVPVKVDTGLNPQLVKQFDIKAIPSDVILQPDGQFVHRRQGGITAERFDVYLNYICEEVRTKKQTDTPVAATQVVPLETRQPSPPQPAATPSTNPWNQPTAPPPVDVKSFVAQQQPQPPVPVPTQNSVERNNPVRTGYQETAAKGTPAAPSVNAPNPLEGTNGSTVEIPLALDGFCPVTLSIQERWQPGNPLFYAMYHGQIFRCVNEETLAAFTKEPAKFAPVAMGEDIVQMVNRNKKITGQRKFGAWFQDRVYLFSSQESLDAFAAKPEFYAEIALKYETALRTRFDAVQR